MAIPTLLLPLDGDLDGRDRDGLITATANGALRWVPGMGGYPARINYARNPTADESDYAFSNVAQGVTRTWQSTGGRDGRGCIRYDANGDTAIQGMTTTTTHVATAGELWTVGAWVKGPAGKNLRILLREGASGSYTSHYVPMTGDWQWVSESRVFETNATVQLRLDNAGFSNTPYTMWVDDVIITPGTLADEIDGHVNGDMGPGFGWLGTPHQSESYREAWALGGAVLIEESTTNYIRNPYFQGTTTWAPSPSNSTAEVDPNVTDEGYPAMVVTATTAVQGYLSANTIPGDWAEGDPCTAFARVRGDGSALKVRLSVYAYDIDGNQLGIAAATDFAVRSATEFEDVVVSTPSLPSGTARVVMFLHNNSHEIGDRFWVSRPQLEKKPYPTSFCPQFDRDGNLLPGYAWTGTPHASASTRDAVSIEIEYPHAFGEAVARYSEDDGETWQTESLDEPGAFGTYGTLDLSDGVLTIGVTSHAVLIDQLFVFDRPLTEPERTLLMNADSWEWQMLYPRLGGVMRVDGGGAPFSVLRAGHGGAPFSVLRAGYGEE